jgi:hypothetical protein
VGLTSYGGCINARVCSRSRPFIELFRPWGFLHSLGRAFGDLKLPLEWRSLLGRPLGARFLLWTIFFFLISNDKFIKTRKGAQP